MLYEAKGTTMKHRAMFAMLMLALFTISPTLAQRPTQEVQAVTPQVQTAEWAKAWWSKRHEEKLKEKQSLEKVDLLMIGDSITHGWESGGKEIWDKYYAQRHPLNIGFSGDRTENVLWRLQHGAIDDISPKLAVIMIGTNNTGHRQDKPEDTAAGIKAILDELHERIPDTKCLLLAIFPRGAKPTDPLRQINDATNAIIAKLDDGQRVFYLDISDQFLDDEGVLSKEIMPDLLHPNKRGYAMWAEAVEPAIKQLMGEK
jgi:beta-glucosidase